MTTLCYSHESAPGASPAQGLDNPPDFLTSMDASQPKLSLDSFSPPQPRFVFPAAPPSPDASPPFQTSRRRRPLSAVETHTRSYSLAVEAHDRIPRHAALPEFSFNPGASLPPAPNVQLLLSPPEFSNAPKPISSSARPGGHGHRRGGSEFVGGRLREGSSIAVLSANPMKPETASPPLSLQPPPPGRRGHRRGVSGTISTNDLPIIAPPVLHNPFQKGNSAPNSPTSTGPDDVLPLSPVDSRILAPLPEPWQPAEAVTVAESDRVDSTPAQSTEVVAERKQKPPKPPVRARVGFSDTLEFIPRPLSLISTDTSSTMTVRPGHSVSGSISSVISAGPSGRDSPAPLSRTPTSDLIESRPGTAGAILDRATEPQSLNEDSISARRRNSIPILFGNCDDTAVAPSTPSPTKTSKRWSFFGLESLTNSTSPSRLRSCSSSSSGSTQRATCSGSSDHDSDISVEGGEEIGKPQKSGKKEKKNRVKGWADSLLPRKSKGRRQFKIVRPPTPPASISHLDDDEDSDTHSVEPTEPAMTSPIVKITEPENSSPRRMGDDTSVLMIDLDAALGPFNTPMSYNPEWEAAQHAADNFNMRRLHSAQGMRGFSGPGMHYHRRSESAPALPPFDSGRAFINRFGSNSTMADVFEEDEEDDAKEGCRPKSDAEDGSDSEAAHPAVVPLGSLVAESQDKPSRLAARRRSLGLGDRELLNSLPLRTECSRTPLQDAIIAEEPSSLPLADEGMLQGSRNSFESGALFLRQFPTLNDVSVVDDSSTISAHASTAHYSSYSMSSPQPSPRSPVSIDAQRIFTAPSSVTDANSFHSLLMGEPGPEVRISMEYDIPSLTSSNSTMTRDSTPLPPAQTNRPALRDQRPVSVSAAFGRRRSSLVSLSRLISSSHGERSKLSMEVVAQNEPPQEKKPRNKTRRLSRLMQFWKPNKDEATT